MPNGLRGRVAVMSQLHRRVMMPFRAHCTSRIVQSPSARGMPVWVVWVMRMMRVVMVVHVLNANIAVEDGDHLTRRRLLLQATERAILGPGLRVLAKEAPRHRHPRHQEPSQED